MRHVGAVAFLFALVLLHSDIESGQCVDVQSPTLDTRFLGQDAFLIESTDSANESYVPVSLQFTRDEGQGPEEDLQYTRFRFLLANSNRNILGATASVTTTARPTTDEPTLESNDGRCTNNRTCNAFDEEVQVSVFASRPVLRYQLTPSGVRVPFAFVHADYEDALPAPPCTTTTQDCRSDGVSKPVGTCTPEFIDATFTDPSGLVLDSELIAPQLNDSCGPLRDPETQFAGDDSCVKVCCHPCTATNRTLYRRNTVHAIGPLCTAYEIGEYTIASDLLATVRIGDNVIDSPQVFATSRPNTPDYAVARRRSGRALSSARTNEDSTLRVEVLDHSSTQPASTITQGHYILVCDYNGDDTSDAADNTVPDQGVYNPYVQNSFETLFKSALESDAHAELPYRSQDIDELEYYERVGGGTVPTYTSLGGVGELSWFYVTAEHYEYLAERTQAGITEKWRDKVEAACKPSSTLFDDSFEVPGRDARSTAPDYMTPCQMSAAINEYAQTFNASVYATGIDDALDSINVAFPTRPQGLSPQFLLERPNMHVHVGQDGLAELIYDPIVAAERPVFAEIGVEIPDYLLPISVTNPVVRFSQGPNCAAVRVLNATTLTELQSQPQLVANVSAGVAFQVELVSEEVPSDATMALSARLVCSEQNVQFLDYKQRATSAADAHGAFPLDVTDPGDKSDTEGFAFTFYTADLSVTSFRGCSIEVYRYTADASPPNYYEALVIRAAFTCDVVEDLDGEEDIAGAIRALAEDAGVVEESSSGSDLALILFGVIAGVFLLCFCTVFGYWLYTAII